MAYLGLLDPTELGLPSFVYKSMFHILGLGVVFHGYFGWLLIMVVYTFDVPLFPLLVFLLDLHINPDGEWRYLDGLGGSRLPLHLVVGWNRKYVVRNRVLASQDDT